MPEYLMQRVSCAKLPWSLNIAERPKRNRLLCDPLLISDVHVLSGDLHV